MASRRHFSSDGTMGAPPRRIVFIIALVGAVLIAVGFELEATWAFPDVRCAGDACLIGVNPFAVPAIAIGASLDFIALIVSLSPRRGQTPGLRARIMKIVTGGGADSVASRRAASRIMTIVFLFIIGLSVILSFDWGSTTPQFRSDMPNIILFGILVAAILHIANLYTGQRRFGRRVCPACGRAIPFDAVFCPYCGHQFVPR